MQMADRISNKKEALVEELRNVFRNKKVTFLITIYIIYKLGYGVGTFLANIGL